MSDSEKPSGTIELSKAMIGCIGLVLAAVITGVFLLISTGGIQTGFSSPTPKPDVSPSSTRPVEPTREVSPEGTLLQPTHTPVQTATELVSTSNDCSKLIEGEHHSPTLGVDWKLEAIGEDRIIHVWSNHWDPNLPEFKLFLPSGQSVSFESGGGSVWIDRPGCDGVAEELFERDELREITFEQYQTYIEQKTIP